MSSPAQKPIAWEDARALLLARLRPLPDELCAVSSALLGRVLAAPVLAAVALPPFTNSSMDGYALRAADAGAALPVAGRISAGDDPPALEPGTCASIATGAPLPDGADTVVPLERAREEGGEVVFAGAVSVGDNVRRPGDDVRAGDGILPAGMRLSALAAAAAASAGAGQVRCARRPRVAVIATGDELVAPGAELRRGQIWESNSIALAARCDELGAEVVAVERVADRAEATRSAFAEALASADLVLSSGGVSVGPLDHVRPALEALGVEQLFWRIAIQPGRPTFAGVRDGRAVIGLPGNPLSALAGMELIARPALAALQGASDPDPRPREVALAAGIARDRQRTRVLPAVLGSDRVHPTGAGLSHQVARAAGANALVLIPPGEGTLEAGAIVTVMPFAR